MGKQIVRRGSIVLVRYPFSDLSGTKVRPAVILTPDNLLSWIEDVLCLFISLSAPADVLPLDLILEKSHPSFRRTGLQFQSVFRAHKLALLHKLLVVRALPDSFVLKAKLSGS